MKVPPGVITRLVAAPLLVLHSKCAAESLNVKNALLPSHTLAH